MLRDAKYDFIIQCVISCIKNDIEIPAAVKLLKEIIQEYNIPELKMSTNIYTWWISKIRTIVPELNNLIQIEGFYDRHELEKGILICEKYKPNSDIYWRDFETDEIIESKISKKLNSVQTDLEPI